MRLKSSSFILASIITFLTLQGSALAGIQASENFDSTNAWGVLPISSFSNVTNANNWIINNCQIVSNDAVGLGSIPSLPFVVKFAAGGGTNSWIISPWISNGVGSIVYSARLLQASPSNQVIAEYNYGDKTNWLPMAVTNQLVSTFWTTFTITNTQFSSSNQYVRLRKLNNVTSGNIFIDSISITYPPAILSVTNLSCTPLAPAESDSLAVSASLAVNGYPDSFSATTFWRRSSDTTWTAIPMITNHPNGYGFATLTNIPAQSAFTPINYFVQAAQVSDGATYVTNSITNTVIFFPGSSYTNMLVTGPINTSLRLSSSYQWQGVAYVSNSPAAFRFQGTSNGVNTAWGDSNQTLSNILANGTADLNATNIILTTTNIGYHLFAFNETSLTYTVRSCAYENFASWTNQSFGTSTNSATQWILFGGAISNEASPVLPGQYAILNGQQGASTNAYLLSPLLTNGIGNISFWYRKAGSSNTLSGTLAVQIAPTPSTPSSNWVTVATLSNILSSSYAFANIPLADLNNQAVRLLNNPGGGNSQVSIDEVVVTAPGAAVYASNLTNSPSAPGSVDTVAISVDLTPNTWATLTNVGVWYRGSTNVAFDFQPMTLTGPNHYSTTTGLPAMAGRMEYFIQYFYSGLLGQSPVYFPTGSPSQPYSYSTTNTVVDYRYETFDSSSAWGGLPISVFSNATNALTGWIINSAQIVTNNSSQFGDTNSTPSYPYVLKLSTVLTNSLVISPWLSNGVGSVVFSARLFQQAQTNRVIVECNYGDGTNWIQQGQTNFLNSTNWTAFTNTILSTSNQYIRLRKINYGSSFNVFFDNIYCAPYPAAISVTNVFLNPGYPAAGQSVRATCSVQSLTPLQPPLSTTPTFYWFPLNGPTNTIPMISAGGGSYATTSPFALTNLTRGYPVTYWVSCSFAGFNAVAADNLSPRSSATNTFITQAYSGSYSNLAGSIGTTNITGRLLTNGLWQSIISVDTTATNFSLQGYAYSTGSGYATSTLTLGNSSNWQYTAPLADVASTGQAPLYVNLTKGKYLVRFDESTGQYLVLRCAWQDFDIGEGDGNTYKGTFVGTGNGGAQLDFDDWPVNSTTVRSEDFAGTPWNGYTTWTNGVGGGVGWYVYNSKNVSYAGKTAMQTFTNILDYKYSFIAQGSHFGNNPLRGIGKVSYAYAVATNIVPVTLGTYIGRTSDYPPPNVGDTTYTTFQDYASWSLMPNFMPLSNVTNQSYRTNSVYLATNQTFDIIFDHISGTQSVYFSSVSVGEWYSESQTTDLSGWLVTGYYVETNASAGTTNENCIRLDGTRTATPTNQFVRSPVIPGGIKYIEFNYSGDCFVGSPTNNPISFNVELSTNTPDNWGILDTISTNFNNNLGTSYYTYKRILDTSTPNLYVRVRNTTPRPGALLLDNFSIPGYATTNDWKINNMAVKWWNEGQKTPPSPRQFYLGAGYLNNSRTSNLASPTSTDFPNTNTFPYIRTPVLADGVGEISFWYRNWTTNGTVMPSKLVIQTAVTDTGEGDWNNTVAIVSNIVNTNDYLYFQISLYDTTSRYVRVYNDDLYTTSVSRVCLDDILVTAPLASSLTLSNLTVTPSIPLPTNTVDISVDVYRMFYNPLITGMTGYFAAASSYAGLTSAGLTPRPMSCISTNSYAYGKWYRYKTTASSPIPTEASDTFVKYLAQVSFTGLHTEVTSPQTNKTFSPYPYWLSPLDKSCGTNQAFYVVLSCPTGSVWINEINVQDLSEWLYGLTTEKYVEVCGLTNVNLINWTFQILNTDGSTQSMYVVTNSFPIPNVTSGFGFFVLGDTNTTYRNLTLTNALPSEGGVRLIRASGIYADAVAFAVLPGNVSFLSGQGFFYAGDDDLLSDASLSLTGTGQVRKAFTWINSANYSVSLPNDGQFLQGSNTTTYIPPPTVTIITFLVNTSNIWMECSGATNGWSPTPWFSTNLTNTNGWWRHIPFNSTMTSSNTYQVYFSRTNLTPCFYKVVVTNGM